jgi:hypothetical protein
MMLYIIRVLDYSALSENYYHFCSTYAFFSVEINAEIDEARRSEDVDGTKYASCLNSCFSMMLFIIRVLDYSALSENYYHFCSTYAFSSVEINAEIDKVRRSEDVDGTKYAFCLSFYFFMMFYMIRVFDYSVS